LVLGCGGETAPAPETDRATAEAKMERLTAAAPAPSAPPPIEGAALVPVEITWEGVGLLHQSYFSDREAMTGLSVALAPLLAGPVQLFIRYDNKTFQGQLRVRVPPGGFLRPPSESGRSIDLAALYREQGLRCRLVTLHHLELRAGQRIQHQRIVGRGITDRTSAHRRRVPLRVLERLYFGRMERDAQPCAAVGATDVRRDAEQGRARPGDVPFA
jgi:hypothetical protein